MRKQIEEVIEIIKKQPIDGCISGSCLLGDFEGSDVDVFVYDPKSYDYLIHAFFHNKMFLLLDPVEKFKWKKHTEPNKSTKIYNKKGINSIKFTYNTCLDVNVILKTNADNIFSVLSSFDMDIIAKGIDIKTGLELDLTYGSAISKVAGWNKWNNNYYSDEIWTTSKVLRQLERCFKYHKRGFNTDAVVLKYLELMENISNYESIFDKIEYNEHLTVIKSSIESMKKLCKMWLDTHEIEDEDLELLKTIYKNL